MKRKSLLLIALVGILLASLPSASTEACEFCNLTGYVNCESYSGTSCSAAGAGKSKRCWINPACACEWGVCLCDGTSWTCYW